MVKKENAPGKAFWAGDETRKNRASGRSGTKKEPLK
jgi:hypothetical protein